MRKFVYTITKKTWNRMYGHGYIYLSVSEIRQTEDEESCPIFLLTNFKVPSGANISSEVMYQLAKIGKIDKEYLTGNYSWWNRNLPFRIWEI